VAIDVAAEQGYQPTPEQIEANWDDACRLLMVASPSNPTGTSLSRQRMGALLQAVEHRGGGLVVDEIYQGLVYGGEEFSALEFGEGPLVINSFSKYFGMTGWRLGWVVAPEELVAAMDRLAQNIFLAPSTPAQYAALAAFTPATAAILAERRDAFAERRDFLMDALPQLGFRFPATPTGAFYLYADCSKVTDDSFAFAQRLLDEAGVALTPGLDFGDNQPQRHIRFAYTNEIDKLEQGVERIAAFLAA
jgi:aspartate/methionine/tyrosine aminotransferase